MPNAEYDDDIMCWPHWLPVPERDDYGYKLFEQAASRTPMEVGSLARLKYTVDQVIISCHVIMEDCEIAWFEAFEAERLNQGTVWFLMPIWVSGTIQHYMVQFTERPKVTQVQGFANWVSLSVRIKNRVLPPVDNIEYGDRQTLVHWPSNLPILQDAYSYDIRKTDMTGTGLPTVRRPEFHIDEVSITAKMSLKMGQAATFEWFERDILNMGTRWFLMPVWISGDLVRYKVRFSERPSLSVAGFWTTASFKLDLEQRDLMHPQVVDWLFYISPSELFSILDDTHEPLYGTMPGLTIIPDGVYTKV